MTQMQQRPRGYDRPLTVENYAKQAQRDFAIYAEVEARQAGQVSPGSGKARIIQLVQQHPSMRVADIARAANVHYQYAWKIAKRVKREAK